MTDENIPPIEEDDPIPPVEADTGIPIVVPPTDVTVPVPDPAAVLTPEELIEDGVSKRLYIPGNRPGASPLAIEDKQGDTEGFFLFVGGYPLFLPREIATGLARFILFEEV